MTSLLDLDDEAQETSQARHGQNMPENELVQKLTTLRLRNTQELTRDEALALAIEAAELNMNFMKLAQTKKEKAEALKRSDHFLVQAERIKKTKAEHWDPQTDGNLIDLEPLESFQVPISKPDLSVSTPPPNATSTSPIVSRGQTPGPSAVKKLNEPKLQRTIAKREEIILWRGSSLNGGPFQPWSDETDLTVEHHTFAVGLVPYADSTSFRLSESQNELLEDWRRPSEALPPPHLREELLDHSYLPTMTTSKPIDLVQDAATDCSLVASLCAGVARAQRGFPKILRSVMFPYDGNAGSPALSPSGKYVARLNFNGCFRRVVIDDKLPVSQSGRLLHVIDRNNPCLLWPALIEKAYLKVRGGYDFPGSNSGTDLWVLTGWIPEQVFLHHDETDIDRLWKRITQAFQYGDVLVTTGTGRMTEKTESATGLVGNHDYAVLDMKSEGGRKRLFIKNPWINGPTWSGRGLSSLQEEEEEQETETETETEAVHSSKVSAQSQSMFPKKDDLMVPGAFWMSLNDLMQYFETLYLNWNPGLFKFRYDFHYNWDLGVGRSPLSSFGSNPQHTICCDKDETVWVLLSKHFKDRKQDAQDDEQFISIWAYANEGRRVILSKKPAQYGPYVDSPQTLLKLDMTANVPLTLVTAEQGLKPETYAFTLSALSNSVIQLDEAVSRYEDHARVDGRWTAETSGGSANLPTYHKNPQYSLNLPAASPVRIYLESLDEHLNIHVKLLHGRGKRIVDVTKQDIVVDSGDYKRGCVVAEHQGVLDAGLYTIVCGTFEAGQTGNFTLHVESNVNASLNPVQRDGAGRIHQRLADASFGSSVTKLACPIQVRRVVRMYLTSQLAANGHGPASGSARAAQPSAIRLSVERGVGPDRSFLISSKGGMFGDGARGVRTDDVDLNPKLLDGRGAGSSGDLWLVLERMGGFGGVGRPEERFHVEVWADVPEWGQVGVWRELPG